MKKINYQKGQALIIVVIFFVFISTSLVIGIVNPIMRMFGVVDNIVYGQTSFSVSESGIEDAVYRLRNGMNLSSSESLSVGDYEATTSITNITSSEKLVRATGNVLERERTLEVNVEAGVGTSFNYGIQTGNGGFSLSNNSGVNGNVYSNGDITGSSGAFITGSAYSANSAALSADQTNGTGTPAQSIVFGNANSTQDFAQSFQVSTASPLNKAQFYVKKTSTPSNCTVRVTTDNSGAPSTTTLASGTLSASAVGTSYAWIDSSFSSNPQLGVGTTYWLVADCSTSSTRYYTLGADYGYALGQAKIGQYSGTWNNTTPSGLDGNFKIFLGGLTGSISNVTVGSAGIGDAHANTVTSSTIAGSLYCQTGSGNNKSCNTSQPDPSTVDYPISSATISDWKNDALAGGVYTGNYTLNSTTGSLGPRKIVGNLTVTNNATLTMTGTLWVTGTISISNNATIRLDAGYGPSSGVIIADGDISISNNVTFSGSGFSGSYIMALSTSSTTSAISLSNNGGAVILYAENGTVSLSNNAGAKEVTGYRISLGNNAVITYESGLANINFVSGPGGSWSLGAWEEVE